MSNKMQLTVKLDQRLAMSQQLTQAITLLQYNTIDLKQLIQQYIETNPLLEVDEHEEDNDANERTELVSDEAQDQSNLTNYSADFIKSKQYHDHDDDSSLENYSTPKSLREYLLEQTLLCKFGILEQVVAIAIIDAIDDEGRLTMSLEDIRQTILEPASPKLEMVEEVLKKIQTFDPTGVAAKDLHECLLIQLQFLNKKDATWKIAQEMITDYFDLVSVNNAKKIIKKMSLSHEQYVDAMILIRSLNPNPGRDYTGSVEINNEPELYVKKIKDEWRLFRTDSVLTHVKINKHYQKLLKESKKDGPFEELNKELLEAQWLMKGLKRRNETLHLVASHIIELQKDFLDKGPAYMKPMNMAEVAYAVNLHESTVSRITTGKYVSTPKGIFELKYFFPSHVLTKTGDACSDTAVKAHIKDIITKSSSAHVHSDEEIAELLREKGINIARRTVAKYRESMKIPPSYQRRNAFFQMSAEKETEVEREVSDHSLSQSATKFTV